MAPAQPMINQIIRQPLETIHSILQHQQEGSTGANVSRAFKDLLMSPGAWDQVGPICQLPLGLLESKLTWILQVPLLTADNVQSLPGSSLVRYFGMVSRSQGCSAPGMGTAVCHPGSHYVGLPCCVPWVVRHPFAMPGAGSRPAGPRILCGCPPVHNWQLGCLQLCRQPPGL